MNKFWLMSITLALSVVAFIDCAAHKVVKTAAVAVDTPAIRVAPSGEAPKSLDELSEELAHNVEFLATFLIGQEAEALSHIRAALESGDVEQLKSVMADDLPHLKDDVQRQFWVSVLAIAWVYQTHPGCGSREAWFDQFQENQSAGLNWKFKFADHYLLTRFPEVYRCISSRWI